MEEKSAHLLQIFDLHEYFCFISIGEKELIALR